MVKREPAKEKKNESTRFKDKQQCLNRSRCYCASTKKKSSEKSRRLRAWEKIRKQNTVIPL